MNRSLALRYAGHGDAELDAVARQRAAGEQVAAELRPCEGHVGQRLVHEAVEVIVNRERITDRERRRGAVAPVKGRRAARAHHELAVAHREVERLRAEHHAVDRQVSRFEHDRAMLRGSHLHDRGCRARGDVEAEIGGPDVLPAAARVHRAAEGAACTLDIEDGRQARIPAHRLTLDRDAFVDGTACENGYPHDQSTHASNEDHNHHPGMGAIHEWQSMRIRKWDSANCPWSNSVRIH
jgi:hypothetical protein